MKLKCPKDCKKKQFCCAAVVTQIWLCDNTGEFIDIAEDLTDVVSAPNKFDAWYCADCGSDAVVS